MRLLLLLLMAAPCAAEEIPLSEVWSNGMSGTNDIRDLPNYAQSGGNQDVSLEGQLRKLLSGSTNKRQGTPKVFLTHGDTAEAIKNAIAYLSGKESKPPAAPSFAVFYSYEMGGYYVHLQRASVSDKVLTLEYAFVPHETREVTWHFALIPLADHQCKIKKVVVKPLPLATKYLEVGFTLKTPNPLERNVSGSSEVNQTAHD
jgi:hypothetical protein